MTDVQFEVSHKIEPGEVVALARSIYGDNADLGCESYFEWLYRDNPWGTAVVATARVNGRLVGHHAVLPLRAWLNGQEILVGQGINTMTRRDYEGRGIFAKLVSLADTACREQAIQLIYAIPNSQAAPWFRTVLRYREVASIPVWVRPVGLTGLLRDDVCPGRFLRGLSQILDVGFVPLLRRWRSRRNPSRLEIRPLDRTEPEVDLLWQKGRDTHRFAMTRSGAYISWRFHRCPTRHYRIWGAYAEGELCAYVVARERMVRRWPGVRVGGLVDLFAEPYERGAIGLRLLVAEAVASLCQDGVGAIMVQAVSGHLASALRGNGFFRIPRRTETWLPLMVRWLDPSKAGSESPVPIHFTAGDHDMG